MRDVRLRLGEKMIWPAVMGAVVLGGVLAAAPVRAQELASVAAPAEAGSSSSVAESPAAADGSMLPDAPSATVAAAQDATTGRVVFPPKYPQSEHPPVAPVYWEYIPPGYAYYQIAPKDKLQIGLRNLYSLGDIAGVLGAAAYSHVTNSFPNYGTDRGAFGQRLGAAAISEVVQGLTNDVVFAPLFHDDTRFFGEGPTRSIPHRTAHAISQVFVTRKDSGGHTVNLPLLLSYGAATAVKPAFYPAMNRNAKDMFSSYAGSLGGAALAFVIDEYTDGVLQWLHLEKKP